MAITLRQQELQSLKCIKIMKMLLASIGAWPEQDFEKKLSLFVIVQRRLIPIQATLIILAAIYYLVKNHEDISFFLIGDVCIMCGLTSMMLTRSLVTNFKEYYFILDDFFDFHLIHHRHKGSHYEKIYKLTNKVSCYFAFYQAFLTIFGLNLFNLAPLYADYKIGAFSNARPQNLSLQFALNYAWPGYKQEEHFYFATVLNVILTYNCSIVIIGIDLLLYLMVFQIIGHIKTLMMDLEIPRPKLIVDVTKDYTQGHRSKGKALVDLYDDEENEDIRKKLNNIVDHHRLIVRFTDRISDFFGPVLALCYLFHLVTGCVFLLECSTKDPKALARFLPVSISVFGQLLQLSVVFEITNSMSQKLMDSVYYSPWECMDVRNQRTVRFLLHHVQKPIQLTAMGMVPVGVGTMREILKTTISYYAMLRSLNEAT